MILAMIMMAQWNMYEMLLAEALYGKDKKEDEE